MTNVINFDSSDVTRPCDSEFSDMGTIIGSHADFDPRDFHFPRSMREGRSPDVALVKSAPVESWGRTARNAAYLLIFLLACVYGPDILRVAIDLWIGR